MQKANVRPMYRTRKFYLGPSAGSFQFHTSCVLWKKRTTVRSAGRSAPYCVGKGCTPPSYPNGASSEPKANSMHCRPSDEAAKPNIHQRWKWLGYNERMSVCAPDWSKQSSLSMSKKKLSQLLGLTPDETETDDNV